MKGDFSRIRFNRSKHYTSVLQQQGRVGLDADANEQCAINEYIRETEAKDVVGPYGGPHGHEGFKITVDGTTNQILIGAGRYYVHGILCENEQDSLAYTDQSFLINPSPTDAELLSELSTGAITVIQIQVYLQVWQRLVTALDDPCLREPALGQADTTARVQTVWRVVAQGVPSSQPTSPASPARTVTSAAFTRTLEHAHLADTATRVSFGNVGGVRRPAVPPDVGVPLTRPVLSRPRPEPILLDCCEEMYRLPVQEGNRGSLSAQTSEGSSECSCQPTPPAGYRGLENQLYRVEIHQPGDETTATFKWSRENGSVVVAVTNISGSQVFVDSRGPDANLGFANGQWVEITDDTHLFGSTSNQPGNLYQIQAVSQEQLKMTMKEVVAVDLTKNPRLRRWDQFGSSAGTTGVALSVGSWLDLENGVQIQFAPGQYQSGDYWLIPARTATGQIDWPPCDSDGNSFQPAHRTPIYNAPLAYIQWDATTNRAIVHDCRRSFASLTAHDPRLHNKHLHGWGVVCGLQMNCSGDRTQVTVKKGYAIDCEGCDVLVGCDATVSLVAMAQDQSLLDDKGNGEVCLILRSDGSFAIEKEDPSKESLTSFLQGTIWVDFWKQCIQPLLDFFRSQFTIGPGATNLPVGPGQQRLDTVVNLAVQLANPTSGQYVFVSSEENQILSDFYAGLRQLLESHTFCGLFDTARPFPQYPFAGLNLHSIFGKASHTRIRIHPDGTRAYTVGGDTNVHVYDLQNRVMAAEVQFPGGEAIVQDVALSADGNQLYATAVLKNTDTVFAVANVQGLNLVWQPDSVTAFNGIQLVSLGTTAQSTKVYAIAKGAGLYVITPATSAQANATLAATFNAVGHLVVDSVTAYVTVNTNTTGSTDVYNSIFAYNLDNRGDTRAIPPLSGSYLLTFGGAARTGKDDITTAIDPARGISKLYAVVEPVSPETSKQALVFDLRPETTTTARNKMDLGENTAIRLAYNPATAYLLLSFEDSHRLGILNPQQDDTLVANYHHPVGFSPGGIALDPRSQSVYVLNVANSTISTIPAAKLAPSAQGVVSLSDLASYRSGVLNAFADLLGGFLEDLKDCFCERLLVDCSECGEDNKLYLGCIRVQNSQVYRICNFTRRRYVKTFPAVGYWLSIVPVIPVLEWLVARFCCAAFPEFFGRFQAATRVGSPDRLTGSQIVSGMDFVKQINIGSWIDAQLAKLSTAGNLALDAIGATVFHARPAALVQVNQTEMVGQPLDVVRERLSAANIAVDRVQPYDPAAASGDVVGFIATPTNLPSGSHVVLHEQNGVVRYYTLAEKSPAAVQDLEVQLQAQQATLTTLQQSQQVIAAQQQTISAHEQEIVGLKESLTELQQAQTARDQDLVALKNQLQRLLKRQPNQ